MAGAGAGAGAGTSTCLSFSFSNLSLHSRLSSDHHAPLSHVTPTFLPPKPKSLAKSLKLTSSQTLILPSSPPSRSLPLLHLLFPIHTCHSTADDVQVSVDGEEEEEEPEAETGLREQEQEQDEGAERKQSDSSDEGRLYVGNLPYSVTSSQLSEIFSEAGVVRSVEIIYDRVTDRSRGFAFVTMGSVDDAEAAIEMFDESQLGGRSVKVNFPEVPRGGERKLWGAKIRSNYRSFVDSPHKVYAGNLGWGLTSQGLTEAFANQPGFLSAKVIYERETGRSRGYGFVSFSSAEEAGSAITSMNGMELEGRPLRLNMALEKARTSSSLVSPQSVDYNNAQNSMDESKALSGASY